MKRKVNCNHLSKPLRDTAIRLGESVVVGFCFLFSNRGPVMALLDSGRSLQTGKLNRSVSL